MVGFHSAVTQPNVEEARSPIAYEGLTNKHRISKGVVKLWLHMEFSKADRTATHTCWHGGMH